MEIKVIWNYKTTFKKSSFPTLNASILWDKSNTRSYSQISRKGFSLFSLVNIAKKGILSVFWQKNGVRILGIKHNPLNTYLCQQKFLRLFIESMFLHTFLHMAQQVLDLHYPIGLWGYPSCSTIMHKHS